MPVTRRQAELLLSAEVGNLWAAVGKDPAVAAAGDEYAPNASFDYALARAARAAGLDPADALTVDDGDLAELDGTAVDVFAKAAVLFALETVLNNWSKVTQSGGGSSKSLSDPPGWIRPRVEQLRSELAAAGAVGVAAPAAPAIGLSTGYILLPGRSCPGWD